MAALFGQVGEFIEGEEEWSQYAECLENFLAVNGITEDNRKMSVFLAIIGAKEYKLLCSLLAPSKPADKAYQEMVETHHNPYPRR